MKLWANHPTYGRTMEELFNTMPDVISSQMMNELSEYSSDFKLSAVLNSAYPCNSKIGTKEGVSLTQRFYAYENKYFSTELSLNNYNMFIIFIILRYY